MDEERTFTHGSREFSLKLYKAIHQSLLEKPFYLYSSFATQACLMMIYMAAEEETAKDIATVLGSDPDSSVQKVMIFLEILMKQIEKEASINVTSCLFLDSGFLENTVNGLFVRLLKDVFYAEIDFFDSENPKDSRKIINDWVTKETNGNITEIISNDLEFSGKKLLFMNAINFKGRWLHPFDKNLTKSKPFWMTKTESILVETMEAINTFNYARFAYLNLSVLEMPYENPDFSLLIMLYDVFEEQKLTQEHFRIATMFHTTVGMSMKKVHVYLPKFEVEYTLDMKEALQQMGLTSIFESTANLTGLMENGSQGFGVDEMIQKVRLKVDEEGAVFHEGCEEIEVEEVFEVNKPFYFMLKNRFKNTVLLHGCIKSFK